MSEAVRLKAVFEVIGDRIWLVTFTQYDLGYFDDETCRLGPIDNHFGGTSAKFAPR